MTLSLLACIFRSIRSLTVMRFFFFPSDDLFVVKMIAEDEENEENGITETFVMRKETE